MTKTNSSFFRKQTNSVLDYYDTPEKITEALFKREKFNGVVYEPACGEGEMVKIITKYNQCISSDIRNDENIFGLKNIDFLQQNISMENIVTNPPYNNATEFLIHGLKYFEKKMAFLCRLNFLESKKRYNIFKNSPLKTVYIFSKRQTLSPKGSGIEKGGMIVYAWFIWEKNYRGKPIIEWICD